MDFGVSGPLQLGQRAFVENILLHEKTVGKEIVFHIVDSALHHPLGLWIGFVTAPNIRAHLTFKLLKLMGEDDIAFVLTDDNDAVLIDGDLLGNPAKELESQCYRSDQITGGERSCLEKAPFVPGMSQDHPH